MPNPLIRNRVREENTEYATPLEPFECVIERITFHNTENGYSVLKVLAADTKKSKMKDDVITVLGSFNNPVGGESMRCWGAWVKHPQFGAQFKSEKYEVIRPATANAIEKYLGSGMVKGIGPVMAKRIVARFGVDALDIIEKQPKKLAEVSGIAEKRTEIIQKAYLEQKEIAEIMRFLLGHGVSPTYAVKIYRKYKERSIEVVEKNPYQLATDIWGIGFKSADKIAQNVGIAPDAPERLEAGLIYVLNQEMEGGGHCFLLRDDLIAKACEILLPQTAPDGDEPADKASVLRAAAIEKALEFLIARELLVSEVADFMGSTDDAIYTPSMHTTEKALADRINTLMSSPWRSRPKPAELDALFEGLEGAENLSEEQTQSVRRALSESLLVLTGGPGTGKTTTTKAIVAAFERLGKKLQIASPTGRAAKRASEVTGREAKTIHRLLAFDPEKNDFKHGPGEPLELDVLIVDESSMLDLVLTYKTLRAVPDGAQVIFVGDVDQLPSVGPGNVLSDLISSGRVPVARLTQVFRQAASSKIITNAHLINRGKMPDLLLPSAVKEGADCVFIEVEDSEEIPEKIKGIVAKSLPRLGYKPQEITVLTPMQRGIAGARNLNEVLQGVLNPPSPEKLEHKRGPLVLRVGDRVMQRRNNYDKNVFNGDVGHIIEIDQENATLTVEYPEQIVEYEFADTDELMHSSALTTHKCIAEYEPVWTAHHGLIPIRDLSVGAYVLTGQGEARRVLGKFEAGHKQVYRVKTKAGFQVDVSAEHPLLIQSSDSDTPTWCRGDELQTGMSLCISRQPIETSCPPLLPIIHKLMGRNATYPSVPTLWNEGLAYLLGAIVGDGSYRDQKDGTVDFTNQDSEILNIVEQTLTGYSLKVCHYQPQGHKAKRLYVVSRAFRRWLFDLGLDYSTATEKVVPPLLFQASASCRAAFLRGLFDTDGSAGATGGSANALRFITASERLSQEVQTLLLTLGIVSRRAQWTPKAWCVSITGTSLREYHRQIGFTVPYKQIRLEAILERQSKKRSKTNDDVIPQGRRLANILQERLHDSGITLRSTTEGTKVAAILSNVRCGTTRLSHRHLNDILTYLRANAIEASELVTQVSQRHYFYDRVDSVENLGIEANFYDIEVEDKHSFVAGDGFVCHNSQGSEYPACIIIVHTTHYMMLQRNLVYTALTRAKKLAVIVGSKRALSMAVKNMRVVPRNTRLAARLQKLVDNLGKGGLFKSGANGNGKGELPTPPLPGRLL